MAIVLTDDVYYKDIAENLRYSLDTDMKFTPYLMSIAVQILYDTAYGEGYYYGHEDGEISVWDKVQDNGNRKDYTGAFAYWGAEEITPKYKVAPTSCAPGLFKECRNLKSIDKDLFDLSSAKYYPNDERSANFELCAQCRALEVFPDIGLQPGYYGATWGSCQKLKTIVVFRVNADCEYSVGTFRGCRELVDILNIEGEIGANIWFVQSPLLSVATQKNIIKHLKDFYGTYEYDKTITFNAQSFERLEAAGFTDEDIEWADSIFGYREGMTWAEAVDELRWTLTVS